MTVPPESASGLSRSEKEALLRKILVQRISQARTLPASFAQERLWFLDRMGVAAATYHVPEALRLSGPLDTGALERSLGEIVRRHETLRTTFAEADGAPVQVIASFAGFTLATEDLSALPAVEREAAARRRAAEDAARPFDLAAGPLFRAALLRLDNEEHVLLLCMHHIVSDGWSIGVLLGELSALYAAYRDGRESPLPELPAQYAALAERERARLNDGTLEREIAYWTSRLAGAPALLDLPTDHPRPAVPSYRGAHLWAELPGALLDRLQALGRSEGATLHMVLLAAVQLLLSKHGAGEDVVVGSPVAGRNWVESEELIGFFVNTLVLRTDLSGDPSFREAVRRVRTVTLDAYEHQETPFEKLVAALRPERSLSHAPLFQAMFTLEDDAGLRCELAGLRTARMEAEVSATAFDLTLGFTVGEGGFRAAVEYATDLFDRGTAERMLSHLTRLLEQVAAEPGLRMSEIGLVDEAEGRVLAAWNETAVAYPAERSLPELFTEQASRTPEAVALVCGSESLTYGEVDARSNRLARRLARLGVGPESRVGVCLERSAEMVVALLAVLKAGGAYVPLDPGYPSERLAFLLADAAVAVLLIESTLAASLPAALDVETLVLDREAEAVAAESVAPLGCAVPPRSLAYVMYTSGSTGTPKGVGVEHRSVVRLVRSARYAELGPGEVVLQAAPVSFDASTFEVWGALLNGGRLALVPERTPSLEAIGRAIESHGVTTLWLTAGLFQVMAEERIESLAGVRQLLAGGDVLPAAAVGKVKARFPGLRLINGYGPTENTTFTCAYTVPEGWSGASLPIGTPVSNTRVHVLDASLHPVPIGVPGELYAGGDGVARGYLGRPGSTAERFVPDPFSGEAGARMYRTGDRARWRADGTIEYLGRLDAQVKVRGFRVEPGEVEAALRRCGGVRECAVVAHGDAASEKRLVAYVVGDADAGAVRERLRESLPGHLVPDAIVVLDALPLTPNGKVDRGALPAPDTAAGAGYVAPRTPVEEVLAGLWAELLRVGRVGARDDFFALGGHSLLATRLVSRVRTLFAVELPLRALFERPTVAEVASAVEALRRAGAPVLPPVVPVARDRDLPLSFAQERLWLLDRMEPGSTAYNVPTALRLEGALDVAALERAVGEVLRRHEALRTVFRETDGRAAQVIVPFGGFALPVEDLSGRGEGAREAEARRRVGEEAALPFDLESGPLFRARLLRLDRETHLLLLSMHHAATDGWSLGVLFRELAALYGAFREGGPSPLAEPPVQYADYAAWQREHLRGEVLDARLAYWRERLQGAPAVMELPLDHPRPATPGHRGAEEAIALPAALLERLRGVARGEGATLYMVLLAAWQALLSKYGAGEDIVVGTPVSGRLRGEVEGLIGFFVNTLVVRTDLSGDPSFREVLRRARGAALGAYDHQDVPFERVVAALHPERSTRHTPLFQVMFALEDEPEGAALHGVRTRRVDAPLDTARFDLSLTFTAHAGELRAALAYRAELFERETITGMLGRLARVLEQAAGDADRRLSALELLDAAERARVVEGWNPADEVEPAPCVHHLFEAQAARTPGAVAVRFEDERLTYAELNARANRLARHLRRRGVGPETRVALCLERGTELVVSVLAVLKAGGAYVPLDPGHPVARLEAMLAGSEAALALTQARLRPSFPGRAGLAVVEVDAEWGEIETESPENPEGGATPQTLAYVIHTSGSTGTPKAVGVEHGALASHMRWFVRDFALTAADRVLQKTPVVFDASVWELYAPLLAGGELVVARHDGEGDPRYLARTVREGAVTVLQLVPSLLRVLADEPEFAECTSLRWLFCGGEALPGELSRRLSRLLPGTPLVNLYGPAECCIDTSTHRCGEADGGRATVPIGRPAPGTRSYVLDAALLPVPAGVPGELCVGGAQVARGYLGRPGATAERFVPDPFAHRPGARMYRTGDRARWRAEGTLEYLGRLDDQVKVRGVRIEPGEVEAALRRHPRVRDCVVATRADDTGETRLVAYVVGEVDPGLLREHLRSLPESMVPSAYVALPRLPLNTSGKVDRGALPAPDFTLDEARYVAPRTLLEEMLAGVWAEVLRRERVGVRDNFFELGGHSLLATLVMARVREILGVGMPLRALFEASTVEGLAKAVETLQRAEVPALPPVTPVDRAGSLPLSSAQERLWFLHRLQGGSTAYSYPVALRLEGALDREALERALGEIVRRHEVLRTSFPERDGTPVQVVAPFRGFALAVEEHPGAGEAEVRRLATEDAARPFDLAAGPLFRARLLRAGAREHVLLLSMHHIVTDGWSMGVLFRELEALYGAYRDGRTPRLPDPAVQFGDYVAWQREQLRGEALERQLAYWKDHLEGAPALLELPTDRPRPAVQTYHGTHFSFAFPATLAKRLEALGRREGATLYMVLLAGFQLLLGRYAGTDDVVVGSSIAGRTRREVEGLIGFFVNTLVLRARLSGAPTFREVLRRVRETTLGAYEHQDVPFEKLVEELQPGRSLGHNPLFQVFFALQNTHDEPVRLPGLRVEGVPSEGTTAKFDLALSFARVEEGLEGVVEYATDLFDAATIRRMAGHLGRVLDQVAGDPERLLSRLELLDAEERALVVERWNRTDAAYPVDACLHTLFEAQAERTPGAAAVTLEGEPLTYRALNERANRLARHLARLGVVPEVRVGVCLERSFDMVVALLAVLKAGGAYVPLDPSYPSDRLAYMLADAGVAVLLTQEALRGALPPSGARVVVVDTVATDRESAANPVIAVDPSNAAYVIYTSGSTGRPKGVVNAHGAVVNRLCWMQAEYGIGGDDVVLQKTPFSFDVSVWELFWPLQQGARLVMARPDGHRDPAYLQEIIEREGVTTVHFVPSMLQSFVEAADASRLTSLKRVVCSGEALPPALVARFHDRFPATVGLYNLYGPTEAAVDVSHWTCAREDSAGGVPIGRPVWNTRLFVLDDALRPVPVGVPGELYIGGAQVARGYLGRPGLTAERFVPDPFSSAGARLYRTGDQARWRADGALEYRGRLDHQVKVRGFRVELGEIEAALLSHQGVRECAAVAREDAPGGTRIVAYVVGGADAEALRAHLRRSLPDHMVPSAFVSLDGLPLSPNGKLDRGALPAPGYEAGAGAFVAPRTQTEEVLAGIWAEVLRLERVGARENFFDLGGHSLLATQVAARIRDLFGVAVPLRLLFEGPTVRELAGAVEALRRADLPVLPPVAPAGRGEPLPLSFAQERLWFLHRMQPESPSYNHPLALRLSGALDRDALERSLGEIVRRHEALRTTFQERDGTPVQVVARFTGFTLAGVDLSTLAGAEREAQARRRAGEDAARPFDLSEGPLFRATLLRLDDEEHVLLLAMHHIVTDGWSTGVLFRELAALYPAYRDGGSSPLPELPVQYADYAVWQRAWLEGEALEREIAYWRERLAGAPALLELPTDHPRPPVQTTRGAREWIELPAPLVARLRALGRREGATLYMVLLGAFQALLARYAGSDDVVVGSPIAGRTRRETEGLIGFFVNTLVLRTDLSGDPTFHELLGRVREVTLGAYEHQDAPFERLVEALRPERSLRHSPLFQVMFALDDAGGAPAGLPGVRTEEVETESATTRFDLNLVFGAESGGARGVLEYNADLFEPDTAARIVRHLERVLEQVAADSGVRLSALELLDEAERARVLSGWNDTAREYRDAPVHLLFAAHARRAPDAVALLHGREAVTYAALDARADALARRLRALGVGPEVPVGLCAGRIPDLLVGVLGIWKAGGAYVPLDPDYPAERLAWIVADAGLPVVVTAGAAGEALPEHGAQVVRADASGEPAGAPAPAAVAADASPSSLAYVIYTSGSTGRPKGVRVEHGSLANLLAATREAFGVGAGDVMPALASHAFDIWLFEALLPLTSGGAVRVVGRERVLDVPALLEEAADATLLHAVPALMRQIARVERDVPQLGRLRRAFVGGDRVPADLLNEMRAAFPAAETHVLYGPTEAAILASAYRVPEGGVEGHPIGRPLANMRLYVCDARGRPQPAGVPGELLIGGVGVARGYLGRRALTAERFVPDPFGPEPGARLYRTGDRARWRADGTLEYLGRTDDQVKIRGFRIEPGEVEAALRRYEGVRECVVVAREDAPGDRRLVAYVVGEAGADELRAHLRRSLPEHMVPGSFVALARLPLSPNGKLDRKALPAPELGGEAALLPPRDEMEARVAEVWSDVLGRAGIGVRDNFFDLGGSSLLLYRVFSRLRDLRRDLRVVDLFQHTTVEELAAHLGARATDGESDLARSLSRGEERRSARRRTRGPVDISSPIEGEP